MTRLSPDALSRAIASGRVKLPADKPAAKRKPAHTPGRMNVTEEKWASRLNVDRALNEIIGYKFEPLKFRLADRTTYTPDFVVVLPDGYMECHEIKGPHIREKNWIKFKMARELYPEFIWRLFQLIDNCWIEK